METLLLIVFGAFIALSMIAHAVKDNPRNP